MKSSCFALGGAGLLVVLGQCAVALAADCFVDSQNGDDSKDGASEANAVKSQGKIPKSCTTVKYKRGSLFNEKLAISGSAKVFTNYGDPNDPLPKFVMAGTTNTGAVVSSYQGGVTIDGLYLANSHGDGSSASFSTGVCVMLGGNSVFQNNEITSCDIGVMLTGTGSKFLNNYVHDLNTMIVDAAQDSGTYINSIGGAEGIFVNGSNNEVAYNTFINCSGTAQWTGGGCDGGATEVSVSAGGTLSGVKIHHNFAYKTCGFFEVSGKGTFADSDFYNNVVIDSGWLMLLQVNETTMSNIRWTNNTVVQHKGSTNAGMVTTIYGGSGTSGGPVSGVTLPAGQVSMTNNLIILDGVSALGSTIDSNIAQTTNLVTTTDPGVKNLKGTSAADLDLIAGSVAIDKGTAVAGMTLDYLNRAVPANGITDIGAFEYGATASPTAGGSQGVGGASINTSPAGGAASSATGGAPAAKGGATFNSSVGGRAGASSNPPGGASNLPVAPSGGQGGNAASPSTEIGGQVSSPVPTGGQSNDTSSAASESFGGSSSDGSGSNNDTAPVSTNPASANVGGAKAQATSTMGESGGCTCRVEQHTRSPIVLGLLGLLWLSRRSRDTRRRQS